MTIEEKVNTWLSHGVALREEVEAARDAERSAALRSNERAMDLSLVLRDLDRRLGREVQDDETSVDPRGPVRKMARTAQRDVEVEQYRPNRQPATVPTNATPVPTDAPTPSPAPAAPLVKYKRRPKPAKTKAPVPIKERAPSTIPAEHEVRTVRDAILHVLGQLTEATAETIKEYAALLVPDRSPESIKRELSDMANEEKLTRRLDTTPKTHAGRQPYLYRIASRADVPAPG
jgi:hypothetical protein